MSTTELTEAQLNSLKRIAEQVKSDFESLQESEIVGRIILVTGRDLKKSLIGYKLMRKVGLLDDVVDRSTDGKFDALLAKNPMLLDALNEFGAVPLKITPLPAAGFYPPTRQRPADVIALLNLPDF